MFFFNLLKDLFLINIPSESYILLNKSNQGFNQHKITFNKLLIEIGKSQKSLNFLDICWRRPFQYYLNFD